jgi:hypothetical protein
MHSLTVQSSYDFLNNNSDAGVDLSVQVKTKKYRALGSPPKSLAQVKDKYSRKVRAELLSHLFSYIKMTTPPATDKRGRATSNWPRLKTCLVSFDEIKPKLSGSRKKDEWRREKPLLTVVASSHNDWNEIFNALQDGILSGKKELMRGYEPVYSFSKEEATNAEFLGYEMDRKRPALKVLRLQDIVPKLSVWVVDDDVCQLFPTIPS